MEERRDCALGDVLVEVRSAVVDAADVAPREIGRHCSERHVVLGFGTRNDGLEGASASDFVTVRGALGGGGRGGERWHGRDGIVASWVVFSAADDFEPAVVAPVRAVTAARAAGEDECGESRVTSHTPPVTRQPVRLAVLNTPASDGDEVVWSALGGVGNDASAARPLQQRVGVDGAGDWAAREDLGHDEGIGGDGGGGGDGEQGVGAWT